MQKPWSFKTIEFIIYVQIGLALVVSCYLILLLVLDVVIDGVFSTSTPGWLLGLLGYAEPAMGGPQRVLAVGLAFFIELIVSSVILFVLKTKSLITIKTTAIPILILRIAIFVNANYGQIPLFGRIYLSYSVTYPIIFTMGSIFIVTFLFLKPVRQYIHAKSTRK